MVEDPVLESTRLHDTAISVGLVSKMNTVFKVDLNRLIWHWLLTVLTIGVLSVGAIRLGIFLIRPGRFLGVGMSVLLFNILLAASWVLAAILTIWIAKRRIFSSALRYKQIILSGDGVSLVSLGGKRLFHVASSDNPRIIPFKGGQRLCWVENGQTRSFLVEDALFQKETLLRMREALADWSSTTRPEGK